MFFSLYIHWPFCLKKCPYCDFNSYAWEYEEKEWVDSLVKEILLYKDLFAHYQLKTIFFGGGTPSLMSEISLKRIMDTIKAIWGHQNVETTIEINPSSIEITSLEGFLRSGINRFSIGVQSLNDSDLQFLGRLHSAQEAIETVQEAAKICKRVSTDFIYTLPYDDLPKWKVDLDKILKLILRNDIHHVSLYQLTIEENTQFANDVRSKKWIPMNQDTQSVLYRHTHKIFNQKHWTQYEISNLARNENDQCLHNLTYWRYGEYLGVGPGAHSRMNIDGQKYKFNNYKTPHKWKKLIDETNVLESIHDAKYFEEKEELSLKDQCMERYLMGLRLREGIKLKSEENKFINTTNFDLLLQKNFIKIDKGWIKTSLNGKLKLNAILRMLFEEV